MRERLGVWGKEKHASQVEVVFPPKDASAYEKEKDIEIKNFLKYTSSEKATGQFATEINQIVERMKNSNSLREEVMFISDEVQYYRRKAREEGREEGLLEGREEGREEGRLEGNRENALKMLKDNELSDEKISFYTSLPLEEIQNLRKTI